MGNAKCKSMALDPLNEANYSLVRNEHSLDCFEQPPDYSPRECGHDAQQRLAAVVKETDKLLHTFPRRPWEMLAVYKNQIVAILKNQNLVFGNFSNLSTISIIELAKSVLYKLEQKSAAEPAEWAILKNQHLLWRSGPKPSDKPSAYAQHQMYFCLAEYEQTQSEQMLHMMHELVQHHFQIKVDRRSVPRLAYEWATVPTGMKAYACQRRADKQIIEIVAVPF